MLKMSEMTILTNCNSPPPAVPCNARPTMSITMFFARAQMTELAAKKVTAARRIGLRPQMSDNLAHRGAPAALARR